MFRRLKKIELKIETNLSPQTEYIVTPDDPDMKLIFTKRKDAELYKKALKLSKARYKCEIDKITYDGEYILERKRVA